MTGRARRLLRGEGPALAVVLALAAVQAATLVPVSLLVGHIFSTRIPAADGGGVLLDGALITLAYGASTWLALASRAVVLRLAARISVRLRAAVLDRLYDLPTHWHEQRDDGRLAALVVLDGERAESFTVAGLLVLTGALVAAPLLVVAIVLGPLLILALVVVVPLTVAAGRVYDRRVARLAAEWRTEQSRFNAAVTFALRTLSAAREHGADEQERTARVAEIRAASDSMRRRNYAQSASGIIQGTGTALAGVVTLVVGGLQVAAGNMAVSELLSFYAVLALALRQLSGAVGQWPVVVAGVPSLDALLAVVDDPTPPEYDGTAQMPLDGRVRLRDVRFGYGADAVLDGVDLELASGETVALVGPNGSGKSTIGALLLGTRRPWSGAIELSGHDIATLDLRHARSQLGVVAQDPVLIARGIWANMTWGRPGAPEAAVRAAARIAGVVELAGWDDRDDPKLLGEQGTRLSGGQAQRIAIARALVGSPRLLVLDEPTNHLDAPSVGRLIDGLEALTPRPTVLLITHDAELAARADRRLLVRGGRIHLPVEVG